MLQQGEGYADTNGVRLHYHIGGDGPPCIAHPGGPGADSRYFSGLAGLSSSLTVVYLDPRGTDGSSCPEDPTRYELSDYAADIEGLRRHLGLEEFILLGHSHGGFVAQQYAISYPGRLSRLILANTAPTLSEEAGARILAAVEARKDEPWYPQARAAFDKEWAGEYETAEEMGDLFQAELPFYFREWDAQARAYAASLAGVTFNVDALRHFNNVEAPKLDLRPRLHEIRTPALVLTGADDFICDVQSAREMAERIPDSRLEIMAGCGHFTFVDAPDRFREHVSRFTL